MQLVSTKRRYEPSTEYYKNPFLIDRIKPVTEMWKSQRATVLSLLDLIRESIEEVSIVLKPVKDIELLERLFIFNKPIEVKRFLLTHDSLITTLFKAYKQSERVFGENMVGVFLEFYRDPEEDVEGLSAIIKTKLSPELSLDLLDQFDEEWWLDVDDETRAILSIMVRPV